MDRFLVRMWDGKYHKMWTFENDGFLECVFECLKQQLAYESRLKVLENISYNHIADGRVFMQCTGLKDKNGKLIYEGDIVTDGANMFEVVWDYNAWCIQTNNFQHFLTEGFEVIGNIHENKDLLIL